MMHAEFKNSAFPSSFCIHNSALHRRRPMRGGLGATIAAGLISGFVVITTAANAPKPGVDWPQFRGIRANGISEGFTLPTSWDVAKGQNIAWKTTIPGMGHASPIVWGDLMFVATSISGRADASLRIGYYGDVDSVADDTP